MLLLSRCSVSTVGSSTSFDFQFAAKLPVYPTIELRLIVGYNQLGYFEPAHDVLPYELNNLFIFDGCEDFCFYPFPEIVSGNQ